LKGWKVILKVEMLRINETLQHFNFTTFQPQITSTQNTQLSMISSTFPAPIKYSWVWFVPISSVASRPGQDLPVHKIPSG
jgi:hypothetical protein